VPAPVEVEIMNNNGGLERTFVARKVLEHTISPPNNLAIADAEWTDQLFYGLEGINTLSAFQIFNQDANMFIKSIGLYCNFADGLVFHTPEYRINARLIL
jgi:hypothetical protein